MTATDESIDGSAVDGDGNRAPDLPAARPYTGENDVARAAARDVARLLDRRGLREVVALAHRVLRESTRLTPPMAPRPDDT